MFKRLIKLVSEEKVSLFIGAGFSREAHAPSVGDLCNAILSQFDDEELREEHQNDQLDVLSNFFVEDICNGSRNSLIELLQEQFNFVPACMDDHHTLAGIPHFHNIFTTNYDTLLEDSYSSNDCQVIRKDADCTYIDNPKPVKIYKIHGDFMNQDFVVITSQDYKDYFKNNRNPQMWRIVNNEFLTKHILFIGYSLADDNIIDIINTIAETVNRNQKDMFLIAPGLDYIKKGQLESMKVHYYDAVAADFLSELTTYLKANIVKDFRHHKVRPDTFSRFCNLHNIDPTISLQQGKDNQVVDFNPLDGKALHHALNLTIDSKYKDLIENMDFEKNGVIINKAPIPNIPYIRIPGKDLLKCTHSVNGVVMNDEFASILIGPSLSDFPMTIRIPSRNFMEKVMATSYSPRKGKAVFSLDCHIYHLEMTVVEKEVTDLGTRLSTTFTFTFKDSYTNNNEAIKWINLIDAFYSKEDVYINELSNTPFNTSGLSGMAPNNEYRLFKEYYENIRQIELISGVNFTTYHGYSEANYNISTVIVSYLNHKPVFVNCPDGFSFNTEAKFASEFVDRFKKGNRISIVSTEDDRKEYTLNDHTFVIPYVHNIFDSCVVVDVVPQDKKYMKLYFHYANKVFAKLFSNKNVDEEFPELTLLEDCREVS